MACFFLNCLSFQMMIIFFCNMPTASTNSNTLHQLFWCGCKKGLREEAKLKIKFKDKVYSLTLIRNCHLIAWDIKIYFSHVHERVWIWHNEIMVGVAGGQIHVIYPSVLPLLFLWTSIVYRCAIHTYIIYINFVPKKSTSYGRKNPQNPVCRIMFYMQLCVHTVWCNYIETLFGWKSSCNYLSIHRPLYGIISYHIYV